MKQLANLFSKQLAMANSGVMIKTKITTVSPPCQLAPSQLGQLVNLVGALRTRGRCNHFSGPKRLCSTSRCEKPRVATCSSTRAVPVVTEPLASSCREMLGEVTMQSHQKSVLRANPIALESFGVLLQYPSWGRRVRRAPALLLQLKVLRGLM